MIPALVLAAAATGALPQPSSDDVRAVDEKLAACGTRHALSSWESGPRGIGCARDLLVSWLEAAAKGVPGARVIVDRFEATSPRTRDVAAPLQNVYLVVDGTDPARAKTAFVVSGHYDSMCSDIMDAACDAPGADDDASGTTVVVTAARLVAARPHRATLVFAALAGEEQGLLGGKRLKAWLEGQGLSLGGLLNNDIVGATNGATDRRVRVFCGEDAGAPARALGLFLDDALGATSVRLNFRNDRFGRGGDHLPFLEAGLPAVRFTEPKENYRHQHQTPRVEDGVEYGDLPKFLDVAFLAEVARLNATALDRLADAPAPPREVIVEGAVKEDATVTFAADADPERSGFEILARDTMEPRFTVLATVAAAGAHVQTASTIDDRVYAVRAVGKNGARSIAVVATPTVKRPAGIPPATAAPSPSPEKRLW